MQNLPAALSSHKHEGVAGLARRDWLIPGIAHRNISKFAAVIDTHEASPLAVFLENLPPGLLIREFARLFAVGRRQSDGCLARPSVAAIADAPHGRKIFDSHPM